ncbi:MAG: Holliday junction resolvase RuvX [Candidatus Omnitrophica bacterium]|nr:Holliday junction resolvase RuvX [Candidatus Omnitrophota bacterium]
MRIMALDVGTKRIGVAMSDELLLTAQGSETIYRANTAADMAGIKKTAEENGVSEIIVGLPISMNGTHSAKTKEVLEFADGLAKAVSIPVKTWDERLTTVQAERALLEANMSRGKRRMAIDMVAAQIILQNYLDSQKRGQK